MSAAPARDPYLDLPLDGVRLVEASAGTGKTFTLATLVTRLVVERGLRVGQVLAVTFTEAATQELRKRIRERLLLALELVDAPAAELAQFAPLLTGWSENVVVVTNGEQLTADVEHELRSRAIELRTQPIAELAPTANGMAIEFVDGSRLERDALFVMSSPRLPDFVANLGLELNQSGLLRIDEHGATSSPGLWAAGDLTSRRHQVVEAMAQGLRSVVAINRQLALGVVTA